MFNPYDEYPHKIVIKRTYLTHSTEYPFQEISEDDFTEIKGFMDTPNTSEKLDYKAVDIQLSRMLYVPFNTDIKPTDKIVFENTEYALIGDVEDQGGQHECLRIPLKRI